MASPNTGMTSTDKSMSTSGFLTAQRTDLLLADKYLPWIGTTAPSGGNLVTNRTIWHDTNYTPPRIKLWDGSGWVVIGGNRPMVRIRRTTDRAVATGAGEQFDFLSSASIDIDTDSMFSTGSPTIVTIKTAGKWLFGAHIRWLTNGVSCNVLGRIRTGSTELSDYRSPSGSIDIDVTIPPTLYQFSVNDTVNLFVGHDNGSTVTVKSVNAHTPVLWGVYQGP